MRTNGASRTVIEMTKDKLGEGERRKRVTPFLLRTISNIFDVLRKLHILISGKAKQREGSPLFYYVYYPGYCLQIIILILGKAKAKGKGHPFLLRTLSFFSVRGEQKAKRTAVICDL